MKNILTFVVFIFFLAINIKGQPKSSFVWIDSQGTGRQVFVYFRNDFILDAIPAIAEINLFADSRYQLFVNGTYINFGPVRFYPAHPQYDTYDISPFLKKGKNTIAVKVLSNGVYTFQIPKHIGGFIAWGEIREASGKVINLETPGNWICKPATGYDRTMPKISFALHVVESFDAQKDVPDWNLTDCDTRTWQKPVFIAKQDDWGTLEPRIIPYLTNDEILPKKLIGAYELSNDIDILSFRIKTPDEEERMFNRSFRLFGYTYIYSPKAQYVEINTWWSEYWLNGDSVRYHQVPRDFCKRILHLNLKEGWNFLFVKYDAIWGSWDGYFGFPKKYGLTVSAEKQMNSDIWFCTAGPFKEDENERVIKMPLPFTEPGKLPKLSAGWVSHKRGESAGNPAWEVAWGDLAEKMDYPNSMVAEFTVTKPSAFIFDLGGKQLARFFADIEAPGGTTVDVAFTEDSLGNRPWVFKRWGLHMGARFIAKEGFNHFETFNPYGCKFLQINIKNNQNKPVVIHKTGVYSQVYPFKKIGSFECSDPMMNAIWEMGWRTLRVCSEDAYDDTPFRERGLYAGDCLPEFATTIATSGDPRLIKRCLQLYQDMYKESFDSISSAKLTHSKIGDFELITTLYFYWYYQQTKDIEFVKKLYPSYKQMLTDIYLKNIQTNGLLETKQVFVEWTGIRKNEYSNTFVNALFARNCEILSELALRQGYKADAIMFKERALKTNEAIHKNCWIESKNSFCDGVVKDKPIDSYYPISSAIMSLFGYTTPGQEEGLKSFFENELSSKRTKARKGNTSPYGGFYLLGALYRNNNSVLAENYIRKNWGSMVLKLDDTMWEDFGNDEEERYSGTFSHAWSSAPTYYLTSQVLGVQLGFPDKFSGDTIYIEPQAESITWARGEVPHPKGIIKVDWQIKGNNLFLNCHVPEGLFYTVKPRGKLSNYNLWLNGKKK